MLFFNSSTYANTDKQDEQSKLIDTFIELKNHEDKNVERYYLADGSLENKTISIIPERNIDFNPDNRQIRYYWKYQFNKNPKLSYDTVKYYYEIDCPHKKLTVLEVIGTLQNKTLFNKTLNKSSYIIPNSVGENDYKLICNVEQLTTEELQNILLFFPKDQNKLLNIMQGFLK